MMRKKIYTLHVLTVIGIHTLLIGRLCGQQLIDNREDKFTHYGARASAFAGAYATEIHDVSSMYWNPAAIAYLESNSILWNYYEEWKGTMRSELFATPLFTSYNTVLSLGVTGNQFRFPDQFENMHESYSYGFDAAFAIRLAPTFSAGILTSLKQITMNKTIVDVFSSGIGLMYIPGPDFSYGIVYSGFGENFEFILGKDGFPVLQRIHTAKNLQIGLTMKFPSVKSERVIAFSLANDKTFGEPGLRYSGGLEWSVTRFIDARIGYVVAPKYAGAKYGFGFRFNTVQADYAVSPNTLTNRFQEFTLSFDL